MQELIVFVIVACATLYLGHVIRGTLQGRKSCGSCAAAGCPTNQKADQVPPFEV